MMICNYAVYRVGVYKMSKEKAEKKSKRNSKFIGEISTNIITSVISTLVVTFILYSFAGIKEILLLPREFKDLKAQVESLQNENKDPLNVPNADTININNYYGKELRFTNEAKIEIVQESPEYACLLTRPMWQSNDIIAEDVETGEKYTAEQLVNERILLPYMINNQENYFYGQFNENNQWDGNCIINTYSNDKLVLIMEAEYDNGVLVSYKQVMQGMSKAGKVWSIADRVHHETYNSGETWNYMYEECLKEFGFEDVSEEDILSVDDFELDIKRTSLLEGYYYGNTSEGFYNDKTDTAYIIKFSDDGYIRTLYKGRFKNGNFDDNTGNAWEIVFDSSNSINRYFYYEGKFENGTRENNKELDYISQEEIDKIISGITFNCELKWYSE